MWGAPTRTLVALGALLVCVGATQPPGDRIDVAITHVVDIGNDTSSAVQDDPLDVSRRRRNSRVAAVAVVVPTRRRSLQATVGCSMVDANFGAGISVGINARYTECHVSENGVYHISESRGQAGSSTTKAASYHLRLSSTHLENGSEKARRVSRHQCIEQHLDGRNQRYKQIHRCTAGCSK